MTDAPKKQQQSARSDRVIVAAKVPVALRDELFDLAERQGVTASFLLVEMIEQRVVKEKRKK